MATRLRIRCINKTDRYNPHERISHVGGGTGENRWRQTQDYVEEGGRTIDVIVATHNGHKYIKTKADGVQPDNLLSLPECPR